MAKTVFAVILTILISSSLQSLTFAAEPVKPRSDSLGGYSLSTTAGGYFFVESEKRDLTELYGIKFGHETIGKLGDDNLGIEGTFNYFNARPKTNASTATGYLLRLDVTYPFPIGKKWLPFVAVGAGGINTESPVNNSKNFLLNFGAGVKYFIENYLAVRVDARQLGIFENSIVRYTCEISAGLSYYFGKERAKKATIAPVVAKEEKKVVVLEDAPVKTEEVAKPADAANTKAAAESQDAPAAVAAPIKPATRVVVVKKYTIEFDRNKSAVKPKYFMRFKEISDTLNGPDSLAVQIDGHTDAVGKLAANVTLTQQRVQSVQSNLVKLGTNPKQIAIIANGPALPIADTTTIDDKKNRHIDILIVKYETVKSEQELQLEAEQKEIERLQIEKRARESIKAAIILQEVRGALAVDSSNSLPFEIINRGVSTEEYAMTLIAPKEFDGYLVRASRPDEKITLLQLAPDEKFKGSVLFRVPAGMIDGQRTTLSVNAVSTKYNDVIFQQDIMITTSAPVLRIVSKLDKQEVTPGEIIRYRVSVINAGALSAHKISIKLQLPNQVDFIGGEGLQYTQDATGTYIVNVDTIDSGKLAEMNFGMKIREDSALGHELLWNGEVIDENLQRRVKFSDRATIGMSK